MQNPLEELISLLRQFNNERDWDQFHNSKDLAIALNVEAGELLEAFLWKEPSETDIDKVKEELADVFAYALLLANKCELDVVAIIKDKIAANALKYPVDKAKGSSKKYSDL